MSETKLPLPPGEIDALLLALADEIETPREVRDVEFDMARWYTERWSCRTAACALGTAALMSRFRDLGLKIEVEDPGVEEVAVVVGCVVLTPDPDGRPYHQYRNFSAAEKLFDISHGAAEWLFDTFEYPERPVTRAMVADRIRRFVGNGRKVPELRE